MKVGIIGMGFVGGTTAKVFSKKHEIFPYDIDPKKGYSSREHIEAILENADVAFICVPTPMNSDRSIDYNPMENSLDLMLSTARYVSRKPEEVLVTIRSTAVSGTTDSFAKKYPFKFAFNPEFLTERNALKDMENTDRVVLGVDDNWSRDKLLEVYTPLFPDAKYVVVNRKTAEMIKYCNNVLLASTVGIANELKQICDCVDVDYNTVKDVMLMDSRNSRFLNVPGYDGDLGFGGKCFPKDLNALIHLALSKGYHPHLLEEVWRTNLDLRKNRDWEHIPGAVADNKKK